MVNAKPFKSSLTRQPSDLVVISGTSGSNDPNNTWPLGSVQAKQSYWGQFYGMFTPGVMLKTSPSTPVSTVKSDASISTPDYDSQQWSGNPE